MSLLLVMFSLFLDLPLHLLSLLPLLPLLPELPPPPWPGGGEPLVVGVLLVVEDLLVTLRHQRDLVLREVHVVVDGAGL